MTERDPSVGIVRGIGRLLEEAAAELGVLVQTSIDHHGRARVASKAVSEGGFAEQRYAGPQVATANVAGRTARWPGGRCTRDHDVQPRRGTAGTSVVITACGASA